MMGFGFLLMVLALAFPVVGIVVLIVWLVHASKLENPLSVLPSI